MIQFKTLAEFKKNIKLGSKLHTIYHAEFSGQRDEKNNPILKTVDKGVREISIVQTNSFACKTVQNTGKIVDSWLQYPKASECKVIDNSKLEIYEKDRDGKDYLILTYSFVE